MEGLDSLASAMLWVSTIVIGGIVGSVLFKLLNGSIDTSGILQDKLTQQFSPARLQTLVKARDIDC